jgi:hypothetical protein
MTEAQILANQLGGIPLLPMAPPATTTSSSLVPVVPSLSGPSAAGGAVGSTNSIKIIILNLLNTEFNGRCSQRSISLFTNVVRSMCTEEVHVLTVIEALEEKMQEQMELSMGAVGGGISGAGNNTYLMIYWYCFDAVLKQFRHQKKFVDCLMTVLPHLLREYVPWNTPNEEDLKKYKTMFHTWRNIVPPEMNASIAEMVRVTTEC